MEDFKDYVEYIENAEADRFDCTPHCDSEGIPATPVAEPGNLFDSYDEEEAA